MDAAVLPAGLTVEGLRERLVERLRTEYGVGVVDVDIDVDVDLTADGDVAYLALGSRLAGGGPTLPPGTAAVAVRADPASAANSGDVVRVWRVSGERERATTAEVRAATGDVVTLAGDEAEVASLSPGDEYRLVTLPAEPRADRELAGLLRAAAETMGVLTVEAGADLVGTPAGRLDVPVVAIRPAGGSVEPLPSRSRELSAGDTVYAVARPDAIRRLEGRTRGAASAPASEARP